jgi:predicted AAA+ superfamily ATPase
VVVDEAQNVPAVFDAVQHLYDSDRRRWRFVLCGSSARKLRTTGVNLLPGRSLLHHLYPLVLPERPAGEAVPGKAEGPRLLPLGGPDPVPPPFPPADIVERLAFGDLPGIVTAPRVRRAELLLAYTFVYLEEELRREALVKDWAAFARFLQLAAVHAGQMINYAAISREAGVSLPTVKTYYQLLEDMKLVPVEVKRTERPTERDTRHLRAFLAEHPRQAPRGYVVCRCPEPLALDERIRAIPWWSL